MRDTFWVKWWFAVVVGVSCLVMVSWPMIAQLWRCLSHKTQQRQPDKPRKTANNFPIACGCCLFYSAGTYECRRWPPAAMDANGQPQSVWPTVSTMKWCGEFVDRERI